MGAPQENHDLEEGTLEIGMGKSNTGHLLYFIYFLMCGVFGDGFYMKT